MTLAFITTPIFYLSGTIWPLQAMPAWVRAISYCIPSTWATKAIAGVNQMGLSLNEVWGDVVMLLVLGIIYTLLGVGVGFMRNSVALRSLLRKRAS
ncbi:ABC-2 type transporter [compost metagenome]